jgi:2'-5' RNA ligase
MQIGIGLLIGGEAHNQLRDLELIISNATDNDLGLYQPPHITIKRPFESNKTTFKNTKKLLKKFSSSVNEFEVDLEIYKAFSNQVIYAYPDKSDIATVKNKLLDMLKKIGVEGDELDTDNFIAHSTIGVNLSPEEFKIAESKLENYKNTGITTRISQVGLFLNVDEKHWIVVAIEKFKTT